MLERCTITYLDTCLPDYFTGFDGHVYAIPISHDSTYKTVLADLNEAVSQEEIFEATDNDYSLIEQSLKFIFGAVPDKDAVFNPHMEPYTSDDDETVYAYFGVKL